jgi:hypothetical protein
VGSRLRGKRLGRWLTERVNSGGAAARIRARKRRSEGRTDEQRRGLLRRARSGDGGGKKGPRCGGVVRLLFERGRVRQGAVGVGRRGRRVEEALSAEQRGSGEADGWAAAIVSGGGASDERGPSGTGTGGEEWGTDRRDRPVCGMDAGIKYGLTGL